MHSVGDMFLPSAPTISTTAPAAVSPPVPSSASNPRRLRGLSVLRNYTQGLHLHLHGQLSSPSPSDGDLARSLTLPSRGGTASTHTSPSLHRPSATNSPVLQRPSENQSTGYFPPVQDQARSLPPSSASPPSEGSKNPEITTADKDAEMAKKKVKNGSASRTGPFMSTASHMLDFRNHSHPELQQSNEPSLTHVDGNGQEPSGLAGLPHDQMPTIKFIPHQDRHSNKPSLAFATTSRTLPHEDCVIRVGRYSERDINPNPPANVPSSAPIGFKSKVVSRRHCEFWCSQGQWYIKDVKSSSGTFLNHIRLSQPSVESRPFPVNDGDVVQLGIDFRGGEEQIFRCVKIRIECNRAWQKGLNSFNMSTHKRLRALAAKKDSDAASTHSTECSICLMSVAPCQSLFVAPCSHVWHFKCIRTLLNDHKTYPQFLCPNCRAVTDLEAEVDDLTEQWEEDESEQGNRQSPNDSAKVNDFNVQSFINNNNRDDADLALSARQLSLSAPADGLTLQGPTAALEGPTPSAVQRSLSDDDFPVELQETGEEWTQRASTPMNAAAQPLTPQVSAEEVQLTDGPLTPRNDAGPFVFDGSAGREAGGRLSAALAAGTEVTATT